MPSKAGSNSDTESILGYEIVDVNQYAWCEHIAKLLENKSSDPKYFACLNPHSYVVAKTDRKFHNALKNADWILPDGLGIVFASKMLGNSLKSRFTGLQAFYEIMQQASLKKKRVFFLGGSDECIKKILERIRLDFPYVDAVEGLSPPYCENFDEATNAHIIACLNDFKPDIIWVGLTAPKQEKWIYDNLTMLSCTIIGPIGAVFDYYSGTIKLAPKLIRSIGLEWFYRLLTEPKRVWRRTFISAPIFIKDIFFAKLF